MAEEDVWKADSADSLPAPGGKRGFFYLFCGSRFYSPRREHRPVLGGGGRSVGASNLSIFGKRELLAHCREDTQGFQPRPQRLLTVLPSADALQRVTHSCALKMSTDRPPQAKTLSLAGLGPRPWTPNPHRAHLTSGPLLAGAPPAPEGCAARLLLWKQQLGVREAGSWGRHPQSPRVEFSRL